jgi:hypothetical protein
VCRPVHLGVRFHTKQAAQRVAATATHHSGYSFLKSAQPGWLSGLGCNYFQSALAA